MGLEDGIKGHLSKTKSNVFLEQNNTPCKYNPAWLHKKTKTKQNIIYNFPPWERNTS